MSDFGIKLKSLKSSGRWLAGNLFEVLECKCDQEIEFSNEVKLIVYRKIDEG